MVRLNSIYIFLVAFGVFYGFTDGRYSGTAGLIGALMPGFVSGVTILALTRNSELLTSAAIVLNGLVVLLVVSMSIFGIVKQPTGIAVVALVLLFFVPYALNLVALRRRRA